MPEFEPTHRIFVSYIDKSREYYLARGFGNPYSWAHHTDAPFAPLARTLGASRLALVTTAALPGVARSNMQVFAAPAADPPALYTEHLSWHKTATHTNDRESFLPLRRLDEFAAAGRIGSASPRFYGVPTIYSRRRTVEEFAPALLELCRADAVEAALFFPL